MKNFTLRKRITELRKGDVFEYGDFVNEITYRARFHTLKSVDFNNVAVTMFCLSHGRWTESKFNKSTAVYI